MLCEYSFCLLIAGFFLNQFQNKILVMIFKSIYALLGSVALAFGKAIAYFCKRIGCAAQCAQHYYLWLIIFCDKLCHIKHSFGLAYAGASKLHYFHYAVRLFFLSGLQMYYNSSK